MDQPTLFPEKKTKRYTFHGSTFVEERDQKRLTGHIAKIEELMQDEQWRTAAEIAGRLGLRNISSVEANIRNLRKPDNGGYNIERRNRDGIVGFSEYRLVK